MIGSVPEAGDGVGLGGGGVALALATGSDGVGVALTGRRAGGALGACSG